MEQGSRVFFVPADGWSSDGTMGDRQRTTRRNGHTRHLLRRVWRPNSFRFAPPACWHKVGHWVDMLALLLLLFAAGVCTGTQARQALVSPPLAVRLVPIRSADLYQVVFRPASLQVVLNLLSYSCRAGARRRDGSTAMTRNVFAPVS